MLIMLVGAIVVLANLAAVWTVSEATRQPSASAFERHARRAARLFWVVVASSVVGFGVNLLLSIARVPAARAAPRQFVISSAVHALAFCAIGGLYPGGAALWLGRQARRRG